MNILDIFSGRTGGQGVQPAIGGAGDGGKKAVIDQWLGTITGVYSAVTGSGTKNGPAPAPVAVTTPPAKANFALWGAVAAAVLIAAVLLFKRK